MPVLRPEASIERAAVRAVLTHFGVAGLKFVARGNTGVPDRVFFLPNSRVFLVEFKRSDGIISPKQEYWIQRLRALGHDVEVHDSVDSVLKAVGDRLKRT